MLRTKPTPWGQRRTPPSKVLLGDLTKSMGLVIPQEFGRCVQAFLHALVVGGLRQPPGLAGVDHVPGVVRSIARQSEVLDRGIHAVDLNQGARLPREDDEGI